jgi:bifunctional ADP-heptose synthase (sugar kinase/adenylyltransferase)
MSRVLVVGESCKDVFVYCDAMRLAPDVPVPVLNVLGQVENAGMAMNVLNSISMFVDYDIITNDNWDSITKTRYVHNATNHMFFRVDAESNYGKFYNNIDYSKYDVIIISDYNKGFLTEEDIQNICESHPRVFVDTKKKLGKFISDAFIVKINDYEYNNSDPVARLFYSDIIIHTMGAKGCEYKGEIFPVTPVEVKDSSGAGDAFMAALVVKYVETNNIVQSIEFANKCASEVVTHRGVTTL